MVNGIYFKLTFLSIFLMVFSAHAGRIAGLILDADTGEPLAGANVFIKGTAFGAATDVDGLYLITNIPEGKYEVTFSYVGYKELKVEVSIGQVDYACIPS